MSAPDRDDLTAAVEARRNDPEFMARVRRNMADHADLLDALKAAEARPVNGAVCPAGRPGAAWSCRLCHRPVHRADDGCTCSQFRRHLGFASICGDCVAAFDHFMPTSD